MAFCTSPAFVDHVWQLLGAMLAGEQPCNLPCLQSSNAVHGPEPGRVRLIGLCASMHACQWVGWELQPCRAGCSELRALACMCALLVCSHAATHGCWSQAAGCRPPSCICEVLQAAASGLPVALR